MAKQNISYYMGHMLRRVKNGGWAPGEPFQISNTNRTIESLENRGLIQMAPDQSKARLTLCFAWIVTAAGDEWLSTSPY